MTELTQEIVKELLHYNQETGVFTWKFRDQKWFETKRGFNIWNSRFAGKFAGYNHKDNTGKHYYHIRFKKKDNKAHRVVWLYMTGEWPQHEIDHIDGNGLNNKWSNLRDVTRSENFKNKRLDKRNSSGTTGVYWNKKSKKWFASIGLDGTLKNLGTYTNKEDAVKARREAEVLHGYHPNHGQDRPL